MRRRVVVGAINGWVGEPPRLEVEDRDQCIWWAPPHNKVPQCPVHSLKALYATIKKGQQIIRRHGWGKAATGHEGWYFYSCEWLMRGGGLRVGSSCEGPGVEGCMARGLHQRWK